MSRNQTWDDRDTETLAYQGFWFLRQGTYNATRTGETGTLASSNDPNANVTFVFPVPAVAFYYYGMQRSRGGRYGICIDCDPNNRNFQGIDALNPTDDGQNPPVLLFTARFQRPSIHEIILRNQQDERFPNENSQITLDRFELEILDPNASSSTSSSTTTTRTTTTSGNASTSTSPAQTASSSTPVGAIVGGVAGGCAALLLILGVWFICRRTRRRRHEKQLEPFDPEPFRMPMAMSQPSPPNGTKIIAHSQPSPSTLATRNIPATKYATEHHHVTHPSLTSTEWTQATGSGSGVVSGSGSGQGSSSNRREMDAGPVPVLNETEEDDAETLPPDYDQVFRDRERQRRSVQPTPRLKG